MDPEILWFRWYAKTYGWTPDQVRELPIDCFAWFPAIEAAHNDAVERRQRMEEAKNRPRGR